MSERLYTFFSFYGGKFRATKYYPKPIYDTIIEPFAGAAGYSQNYYYKNIILYEIDPKIYGVWNYLIHVKEEEILSLPEKFNHVDELNICQEAKWLIGFCVNNASHQPRQQPSTWMKSRPEASYFWNIKRKNIIVSQLKNIRHWKIYNQSYEEIDNLKCSYFIDPPYNNNAGKRYKYHNIDYYYLSQWCKSREG